MATESIELDLDGTSVTITNPAKPFFPALGLTKLDLVEYYLAVAGGAVNGCRDRPTHLVRFPDGVDGFSFHQKRVPEKRPHWLRTCMVSFPSGRTAEFLSLHDRAHLAWAINLGCLELHPWNTRCDDVEHPDELRIDLDPTPEATFEDVRTLALVAREVLEEHGLRGFAKTSGKRGIHVLVRIEPRWSFLEVRRAALAIGREIERREPALATTAWWKEERHGVFIDYNQNARDRTLAAAYSVRPTSDGRVSCPIGWDEVADVDPADLTITTVPARYAERGDAMAAMDDSICSLDAALELSARDEREGLGDAPWPPNFPKMPGEPKRVAPSRARKEGASVDGAGARANPRRSRTRPPKEPAEHPQASPESARMSSSENGAGDSN